MELPKILTWIRKYFQLGDVRRSRALAEIVWGVMQARAASFAAIGQAMDGVATAASRIRRVFRFCHNRLIDPQRVQAALINLLVGKTVSSTGRFAQLALVSLDWHDYDNGRVSGLRVSLITGSRALPILWYEVFANQKKGQQSALEKQALRDLVKFRPAGVRWVVLLDAGFHSTALAPLLEDCGYYILRQTVRSTMHSPSHCWATVKRLLVRLHEVVEFGWVHWTAVCPTKVRLVATRLYQGKRPKRGRRSSIKHYKYTDPGFCVVTTNIPEDMFHATGIIRLYARRFEIEHSFRDLKNAKYGLDMEHVHLDDTATYSRLMCVVAIAEALQWLCGAEAEHRGLQSYYNLSRPASGRRPCSLRNLGRMSLGTFTCSINRALVTHLRAAILQAPYITGHTWRDPVFRTRLVGAVTSPGKLPDMPRACARRTKDGPAEPCCPNIWVTEPYPETAANADLEPKAA